jgi:thiosulfate/3-mercaptopyruvate sulfurtransferase
MRIPRGVLLAALLPLFPMQASPQDARQQMLVDVTWLQQHLRDPNLVLIQVGERPEYDREHIPGARFVPLDDMAAPMDHTENMDHSKQLMLELPKPEVARATLEKLGIHDASRIIVYYGSNWVTPSTRVLLTLHWLGLNAQTSLLDGGMRAWQRSGGAVTAELPTVTPGKLSARPLTEFAVDDKFVRANLKTPNVRIIDARNRSFYDGVEVNSPRPGHIAGAISLPFTEVTDSTLLWRSPNELKKLFERAGYKPGDTIVAYCHVGQQATAIVFAARTLGYKALLYDGSYTQWEVLPDSPVEKTPPKGL